jgi:hypothetical protein
MNKVLVLVLADIDTTGVRHAIPEEQSSVLDGTAPWSNDKRTLREALDALVRGELEHRPGARGHWSGNRSEGQQQRS